jgi:hypothetical protein
MSLRLVGAVLGQQFDRITRRRPGRELTVAVAVVNAVNRQAGRPTPRPYPPARDDGRQIAHAGRTLFHEETLARLNVPLDPQSSDKPSVVAETHCLSIVGGLERGCNHVESR